MKEHVSDLFSKIVGEERKLEELLKKVPGLGGYMEKNQRREADAILRQTIVDRLERTRVQLSNVHQEIANDIVRAMDFAAPLGRADTRLMGLIGKINDAPQGYEGFFDAIKVKEDDLARLYAFDENMLNHAEAIDTAVSALESAAMNGEDLKGLIRELDSTVQAANETFAQRNEVLLDIQ